MYTVDRNDEGETERKNVRVKMRYRRINTAERENERKREYKRGYVREVEGKDKGDRGKEEWKICETFNRRVEQSLPRNIYLKKRHWKSLSARISSILNIKWAMRFFPPREKKCVVDECTDRPSHGGEIF